MANRHKISASLLLPSAEKDIIRNDTLLSASHAALAVKEPVIGTPLSMGGDGTIIPHVKHDSGNGGLSAKTSQKAGWFLSNHVLFLFCMLYLCCYETWSSCRVLFVDEHHGRDLSLSSLFSPS